MLRQVAAAGPSPVSCSAHLFLTSNVAPDGSDAGFRRAANSRHTPRGVGSVTPVSLCAAPGASAPFVGAYRADMSRRQERWRFALQIVEGPNAGLGAGSWRVWTSGNDIYVASLTLISTIKASLHQSGRWRVAYTHEHMTGPNPLWGNDRDRAVWKFAAPAFVDGAQDAFVIATWRNALRPCNSSADDTIVVLDDRWDVLTGVKLVVTKPGIDAPRPDALVYDEPLVVPDGRRVWLEVFEDPAPGGHAEPVSDGQMVRVLTPESDAVPCPGFLVVAVRVDAS